MKKLLITISAIVLLSSCDSDFKSEKPKQYLVFGDTVYMKYLGEWTIGIVVKNDTTNKMLYINRDNILGRGYFQQELVSY